MATRRAGRDKPRLLASRRLTAEGEQRRQLRAFPIQLAEVHCAELHGSRRDRVGEDPEEQRLEVETVSTDLSDDALAFRCMLTVRALAPVLDDETTDIKVTVVGTFASPTSIDQALYSEFIQVAPLVQLWPYARAYLAGVGTAMGVELPVLPLIDAFRPVQDGGDSDDDQVAAE